MLSIEDKDASVVATANVLTFETWKTRNGVCVQFDAIHNTEAVAQTTAFITFDGTAEELRQFCKEIVESIDTAPSLDDDVKQ